MPCIICADIESLIKKIDGCVNNPENSSTNKVSIFLVDIQCQQLDHKENKDTLHCGKDSIKRFCQSLREHGF